MRAKEYNLMAKCIEDGIVIGYKRAFKHSENPNEDFVRESIYTEVLREICENFYFDNEKEE